METLFTNAILLSKNTLLFIVKNPLNLPDIAFYTSNDYYFCSFSIHLVIIPPFNNFLS